MDALVEGGGEAGAEVAAEMAHDAMERARFREMKQGTREDWAIIAGEYRHFATGLPERVLDHLRLLDGDFGGFPVCRLEHSLQTATRAYRDGQGEPYVVMALLHDIGDTLGSYNHPEVAAAILKPFVSEELHWICQNHGTFQGYYYFHFLGMDQHARDRFRDHPHFEACREFCEKYDQAAFDPDYESEPLEFFEPMVRRVMARPLTSMYAKALSEDA
jgi:predicted HD phosphohydrolase